MSTEAIHVIANPAAASGRGARITDRVRRSLESRGLPYSLHRTRWPGDAADWAAALPCDAAPGPILVVGGDGTLHEVANGLLRRPEGAPTHPIAVLPVGTGNDFHRMLRTSGAFDETLDLLQGGVIRNFDVGRVRWGARERHFVNLLGVGIDVAVLETRGRFRRLPGLLQYMAALIVALARFRPVPTVIDYQAADGGMHRLDSGTLLSAVTVGPSVGGGFRLAPQARPDDGLLDLFQVERLSIFQIARVLPQVVRGTQREGSRVHLRTLTCATIRRSDHHPLAFELDGEVMSDRPAELQIDLVPAALGFLDRPARDEVAR